MIGVLTIYAVGLLSFATLLLAIVAYRLQQQVSTIRQRLELLAGRGDRDSAGLELAR